MIKSTKNVLKSNVLKSKFDNANVILGIKISRASNWLILSQPHYVDKILGNFNKNDIAVSKTHLNTSLHLSKNRRGGISQLEYTRMIGSLIYLTSYTRPDLTYTVSKLSRYTSNLEADHWKLL